MTKVNRKLGTEVKQHLFSSGLESPVAKRKKPSTKSQQENIEFHFTKIIEHLNLNLDDPSIANTPSRVAKMYCREIFSGLDYANFPDMMVMPNSHGYDQMLIERQIPVKSMCEHHFVPISGIAHVAYIPNRLIIGLSKLNRIVEFFARRPQLQERLTEQIKEALAFILDTPDVAVMVVAEHHCVKLRGVEHQSCDTVTSAIGGAFKHQKTKTEFMTLCSVKS